VTSSRHGRPSRISFAARTLVSLAGVDDCGGQASLATSGNISPWGSATDRLVVGVWTNRTAYVANTPWPFHLDRRSDQVQPTFRLRKSLGDPVPELGPAERGEILSVKRHICHTMAGSVATVANTGLHTYHSPLRHARRWFLWNAQAHSHIAWRGRPEAVGRNGSMAKLGSVAQIDSPCD